MLFLIVLLSAILIHFINIWWLIVPVAFAAAILCGKSSRHAFWSAFLANSVIWTLMIIIKMIPANNILVEKISGLMFLPHWSLLVILAVLIGGLISGSAALAGYLTKQLI